MKESNLVGFLDDPKIIVVTKDSNQHRLEQISSTKQKLYFSKI